MYEMFTYVDKSGLRRLKIDFVDISNGMTYMEAQHIIIRTWFKNNFEVDITKVGYYGRYDRTGVEYVMENTEQTKIAVLTFKLEFI